MGLKLLFRFSFNPLESRGIYSAASYNMKLVHWSLMGGLLHLVQRGGDYGARPWPLLAVRNVTAHPSTASVPVTVLRCRAVLMWALNWVNCFITVVEFSLYYTR